MTERKTQSKAKSSKSLARGQLKHGAKQKHIKREGPKKTSPGLHPNNRHQGRYDFDALCAVTPELKSYVIQSPRGDATIDFSHSEAVLCLNKALLASFYGIKFWGLPDGYLCPPIPGRADYIHHLSDLIGCNAETKHRRILDVGTGANLIYPIIGAHEYGWSFVASDIDRTAFECASVIAKSNKGISKKVSVVHQKNQKQVFTGVVGESDFFDACMCNPPFHASAHAARVGSQRKWRNLEKQASGKNELNFGGNANELWCEGGEKSFISRMISESIRFQSQIAWFTCLVSKQENLAPLRKLLAKSGARDVRVVNMTQGQKQSRILAWRFSAGADREA